MGDFNCRLGKRRTCEVIGRYGEDTENGNGQISVSLRLHIFVRNSQWTLTAQRYSYLYPRKTGFGTEIHNRFRGAEYKIFFGGLAQ